MTITGTGFVNGATVQISGNLATGVTWVSSTSLTATTAAHAVGAGNVVVKNPDAQTGTKTNGFTYSAPTVSSVAPTSGPLAGGTVVTITGTYFGAGATVKFGGVAATSVIVVSATSITAHDPAHAAGAVNVLVTNTDGLNATLTNGFTYLSAPTLTSISPVSGPVAGGTTITLTGTNYVNGGTAVTVGGVAATGVVFTNTTTVSAVTPSHASGATDVVVTTGGGSATLTNGFTYVGSLTITAPASSFSYNGTLTGSTFTLSSSTALSVSDSRGSGAGWNLQATIGVLTTPGSDVIPASDHTIGSVAISGVTGVSPTNSVAYPLQIPTSAGKVFNAALTTGTGQSTETFTTHLTVPADAANGVYSATLTISIVSGP